MAHISRRRAALDRRTWDLAPVSAAIFGGMGAYLPVLQAADPFRADCLVAYVSVAVQYLREHGFADLMAPLVITPTSSLAYIVPLGESSGRVAGLMARAQAELEEEANEATP